MIKRIYIKEDFDTWFKGSKVVDENGKPLVVYHGTNNTINQFDLKFIGSNKGNFGHYGYGIYFSYDMKEAQYYGKNIIKCYLNIKNPFYGGKIEYLRKYAKEFGNYEEEVVGIEQEWLLNELKKKDIVSYNLSLNIIKLGYENGWEKFLKTNEIDDAKLDLNHVTEWTLLTDEKFNQKYYDYVEEDLEKVFNKKPKLLYDYNVVPSMHFMTDLGNRSEELTDRLKRDGYDGVIAGSEIVAFYPNQIKSVDAKEFNPGSNNIYEGKK